MRLRVWTGCAMLVSAVITASLTSAQEQSPPATICADAAAAAPVRTEACTIALETATGPMVRSRLHASRARAQFAQDHYEEAARDFTTARELHPAGAAALSGELVQALNRLGNSRFSNGDREGAITAFSTAIRADPRGTVALRNRGRAQATLGRMALAEADFNEAIRVEPLPVNYLARSDFWLHVQNYERALEDSRTAVVSDPSNIEAIIDIGEALRNLNRIDEAIEHYTQAIERFPRTSAIYNDRGRSHNRAGRRDAALADYNRALEIDPNYFDSLHNRAIELYFINDHSGALRDANAALQLRPRYVETLMQRGFIYRALGDHAASLADFNAALTINPQHALARTEQQEAVQRVESARIAAEQQQAYELQQQRRAAEERAAAGRLLAGAMVALRGGDAGQVTQALGGLQNSRSSPAPTPQTSPGSGAGAGQCGLDGFNAQFSQLTSSQPINPNWGSRDTFQYSYFLGTRGLEYLEGHSSCMSAADYQANRQALEGMRDQGRSGCEQLSTSAASCRPAYPGN